MHLSSMETTKLSRIGEASEQITDEEYFPDIVELSAFLQHIHRYDLEKVQLIPVIDDVAFFPRCL